MINVGRDSTIGDSMVSHYVWQIAHPKEGTFNPLVQAPVLVGASIAIYTVYFDFIACADMPSLLNCCFNLHSMP